MLSFLRFRFQTRHFSDGVYKYDLTSIRQPLDGRSTAYQRSLRSQWRKPVVAVTLTY